MDLNNSLTVSSSWLEYLIHFSEKSGCQLDDLLATHGVCREQLTDQSQRFDLAIDAAIFQAALDHTEDNLFGLHMGEGVRPSFAGLLGYASMSSNQLRDSVELLAKYEHYYTQVATCELMIDDDTETFRVTWDPTQEVIPQQRHRVEAAFSSWVNFGRWITGTDHSPMQVEFSHAAPTSDLSEYERIFNCPVLFNCSRNTVQLNNNLLDLKLLEANPEVNRVSTEKIKSIVAAYEAKGDLLKEVRVTIRKTIENDSVSLESVAEALNIKPWTLRRKLRAQDSDFSSLLDEVRKEIAVDLLRNEDKQISEIANSLGYSEQSAFNRAFKRWFSCTPLEFRNQNRD